MNCKYWNKSEIYQCIDSLVTTVNIRYKTWSHEGYNITTAISARRATVQKYFLWIHNTLVVAW